MRRFTAALVTAALVLFASTSAQAFVLYYEDFDSGDGGFTVVNSGTPEGPWRYDAVSTWLTNGSENLGAPSASRLNGPPVPVTTTDPLLLTFDHRYSIEYDGTTRWDGGAVFLSVNGGPYTHVPGTAFDLNGYVAVITGNNVLNGLEGFNDVSPGYGAGDFITSIADLGSFNVGDTVSVQFVMAWDEFAKGAELNWQIDSVMIGSEEVIPEPATLALLGAGLAIAARRRRRRA